MSIANTIATSLALNFILGNLLSCNSDDNSRFLSTNTDTQYYYNNDVSENDNMTDDGIIIGDNDTSSVTNSYGESDSDNDNDSEITNIIKEGSDQDSEGEATLYESSDDDPGTEHNPSEEDSETAIEVDTSDTSSGVVDSDTEDLVDEGTVEDYGAPGPFSDAKMFTNLGPGSGYTLFRPDASLGRNGFKHPIVAWGNGMTTTPAMYETMLTLIATHGFVIIATNSTQPEEDMLVAGLEWLIDQNASGVMAGKLDISREATIGYSWGGGASIDTARRPNIRCTASLHGMPPRGETAFEEMHAPLLLTTSTGDTFVSASEYVTPNYNSSTVQTFYGTLNDTSAGHLYIVENNTTSATLCAGGGLLGDTFGECQGAPEQIAVLVAWLRLWVYGDENGKKYFYGDDCILCKAPWTNPQRKNWP